MNGPSFGTLEMIIGFLTGIALAGFFLSARLMGIVTKLIERMAVLGTRVDRLSDIVHVRKTLKEEENP